MNRVIEYAARPHHRRGTAYGNASLCLAGIVLSVPLAMYAGTAAVQSAMKRPLSMVPPFRLEMVMLDAPAWLTVCLPVLGLLLGGLALGLRCKRHQFVALGVLINVAGLIAAIAALLLVG
jgi:hypothetical protein